MGRPLQVLMVEDVEADALLVLRELARGGFDVTHERVETHEAMGAALARRAWDVVICDHSLPRFSAPEALALLKSRNLDLPFIIVSGTVNEEIAIDSLHAGAADFIAKGKLARLNPAIERELRDVALRAEQAKLEKHLLVADRMASVGTLAAGVGHEINNPLAALVANVDFALDGVATLAKELRARSTDAGAEGGGSAFDDDALVNLEAIVEPLRDARDSADRIRRIVRDLKVFSRTDDEKPGPIDVRRVVESATRMAWNEVRHRARLVKDFRDVPHVEANEGRLGQVFLNLVVNAAQSIAEGSADRNEVRVATRVGPDGRVVVEVSDTGAGIPASNLVRIFDPFFTTKPIGMGTGLGLAISHRIVTELGGELSVQSEVGVGSLFRVTLRAAVAPAVASPSPAPPSQLSATRRGRVLVVDDEPAIGAVIRRVLVPAHDVTVATSGRDALDKIAAGERFDVILCDLMMPDVTGMDLHAELARTAEDQADKLVFMTGGAFTNRAREFLAKVVSPRVEKPIDAGTIRAIVHGMLVGR